MDYWCVDVEDVERRITPRTKAVIGVHLFGQCYDPLLINLCERHNIALIEDAAQAHGGSILMAGEKQMVGALGTVSCFSFFPSKNVAVGGEGGMITSADSKIGLRIRSIVDHGRDGSLQSQEVGTNMRMSEVLAAIGRKQLEHLDIWVKRRRMNAERFTASVANNPLLEAPLVRKDTQHAWHQYCVKTASVEEFVQHMSNNNIASRVIYPTPCHKHPVYSDHPQSDDSFATTDALSSSLVAIPVHHELTEEELQRIVQALQSYC